MSEISLGEILGMAGAAVAWLYQVMRSRSRRDKIKTDLEILEKSRALFGRDDERTRHIEATLKRRIANVYDLSGSGGRKLPVEDAVVFVACAAGVAYFAWRGDMSGWDVGMASVLAFIGLGAALNAYENWYSSRARPGEATSTSTSASPAPTSTTGTPR